MKTTMINLTVTMCVCVCKSLLTIQAKRLFIQMLLPAMMMSGITQAASGQSSCYLEEPRLYGPYPEPGGNIYLKVYVNFINPPGNSWISQAEADASAGKTMEALNAAFNGHDIYFVNGLSTCKYDTANVFQSDLDVESIRSEGEADKVHPDGIDIYVLGNTGSATGWAYSAPSLFLHTDGSEGGAWANESPVVVHEMGHALGLLHTHETLCNTALPCPGQEPACNCTGDLVCDTESHTDSSIEPEPGCQHPILPEHIVRNFMSYTIPSGCRDRFTAEQARRMHAHLNGHPMLAPLPIALPDTFPASSPAGISGDIIILSGEFVINSPLEMMPGASITVKPGATLRVKSAIAGACGQMWEGITVEGDIFEPQSPATHGKVAVVGNGLIENAICGVRANDGGIVEVWGGDFRNNATGIQFDTYPFTNASLLYFGFFTIADGYLGGDAAPVHLRLSKIKGLSVYYTTFTDERVGCDPNTPRAKGIYSEEAGFRCTASIFEGLGEGIYASQLRPANGSLSAFSNTFRNCHTGLWVDLGQSFLISKNEFFTDVSLPCPPHKVIGANITGNTLGFTFAGNAFSQDTILPDYTVIGANCAGTSDGMGNTIQGNTYENLLIGNRASGDNGYDGDGLLYLCNTHLLTAEIEKFPEGIEPKDYEVTSGGNIRRTQGQLSPSFPLPLPTGNSFSKAGYTFYNDTLNPLIEYYYDGDSSSQAPGQTLGAVGIVSFEANGYTGYCAGQAPCTSPCSAEEIQEIKTDFYQHRLQWKEALEELPFISDEEEREQTQDTIHRLRLSMNREASLVLQHYALDTVEVKTDSILRWLELAETFSADYHRARHYFFTGQLALFDRLWPGLPYFYELTGAGLAEYNGLGQLFSLLRPFVQEGEPGLNALPDSILDGLLPLLDQCWEPGFLAANLLRRNGLSAEPPCLGEEPHYRQLPVWELPTSEIQPNGNIRLYPNPAQDKLFLELPIQAGSAEVRLYSMQGALVRRWRLGGGAHDLLLGGQDIRPGVYVAEVRTSHGEIFRQKVILSY